MPTPHILPLGFIDRTTPEGVIFILTNPEDSRSISPDTPVTLWRYRPEYLAIAKVRGTITGVGYTTATFTVGESRVDPRWPQDEDPIQPKTPVYLALPGSYEPDPSRMLSREEAERMERESARYRERRRTPGAEASDAHPGHDLGRR